MTEEKSSGKASTRAKNKYNAKTYDQFLVTVPAGQKEIINTAAKEQGYNSRNEFIVKAINEKKSALSRKRGTKSMSEKERAIQLLDHIPDWKMSYVLGFLEGVAIPDEIPNAETLQAFDELKNGNGIHFTGSTDDLFKELAED